MNSPHSQQTFFTPPLFSTQKEKLLSQTYNLAHILLNRSQQKHIFIPIRSLQYLAIVEVNSFWFVDSMAYAVHDNEGGRLITVSWHPVLKTHERVAIHQHMDCEVRYYQQDQHHIQTRLRGEFFKAMQIIDQRYRETLKPSAPLSIISVPS